MKKAMPAGAMRQFLGAIRTPDVPASARAMHVMDLTSTASDDDMNAELPVLSAAQFRMATDSDVHRARLEDAGKATTQASAQNDAMQSIQQCPQPGTGQGDAMTAWMESNPDRARLPGGAGEIYDVSHSPTHATHSTSQNAASLTFPELTRKSSLKLNLDSAASHQSYTATDGASCLHSVQNTKGTGAVKSATPGHPPMHAAFRDVSNTPLALRIFDGSPSVKSAQTRLPFSASVSMDVSAAAVTVTPPKIAHCSVALPGAYQTPVRTVEGADVLGLQALRSQVNAEQGAAVPADLIEEDCLARLGMSISPPKRHVFQADPSKPCGFSAVKVRSSCMLPSTCKSEDCQILYRHH